MNKFLNKLAIISFVALVFITCAQTLRPNTADATYIPIGYVQKIATVSSLDVNTLATTTLSYETNVSAANSIPMYGVVRPVSGSISLAVISMNQNGSSLRLGAGALAPLSGMGGIRYLFFPIGYSFPTTAGNYDVTVTTINGGAATVDVEIWGIRTN